MIFLKVPFCFIFIKYYHVKGHDSLNVEYGTISQGMVHTTVGPINTITVYQYTKCMYN